MPDGLWSREPPSFPAGTVVQLLVYSTRTQKMGIVRLEVFPDGNDFRGWGGTHRLFPSDWRWMPLPDPPTE